MADVRKEGPHYRTLRRIYQDKEKGYGRTLLFGQNKLIKEADVKKYGLKVADEKKPTAPKKTEK